jgi:hypothetical protein
MQRAAIPALSHLLLVLLLMLGSCDATKFLKHVTCNTDTALEPPVIYADFTDGAVDSGQECVKLCEKVDKAGAALYYATDAKVFLPQLFSVGVRGSRRADVVPAPTGQRGLL